MENVREKGLLGGLVGGWRRTRTRQGCCVKKVYMCVSVFLRAPCLCENEEVIDR